MGFSIKGYVLEPPRMGQSNSPFTAGPNNFVPQTLLPGLFTLTQGSSLVPTTANLTSILSPGNTIIFQAQLGVSYTVFSVSVSQVVLRQVFSGLVAGNTTGTSTGYSPQIGTEVAAYNAAYPPDESKPRDDYLVLCTTELAPGSGTPFTVTAVQNFNGLIQITTATGPAAADGQTVIVSGVQGVPGANGTFTVTVLDATDYVLNNSVYGPTDVYTGGGTFLVINGAPGLLTTAGFGWTKNEIIQRFDYDSHKGRFWPLPGGKPVVAGNLSSGANSTRLKVPPPFEALPEAPFRLSIGSFGSGITQTVSLVLTDANFGTPPPGTTELSLQSGNLNWNTADLTTYNGQSVQFQQQQYFAYSASTGDIGTLSTSPSAPAILLNPIPGPGQFPLIRIGFLYWLTTDEKQDEAHFNVPSPPPPGTVQWARDTGRLNFNSADIAANDATVVYQDGTLFTRDVVLPRVDLGPMPPGGLMGPISTPIPATGDIIFSIPANPLNNTPYYQFPNYEIVGAFDSGNSGTVEILQGSGQVQFSGGDAGAYQGNHVIVVFGDLPIEHGISMRFYRSYVNLNGQTPGVKDVTAIYSVQNAVWASPIQASPLVFLPSTPVDDGTLVVTIGQGTGTFTGLLNPVGGINPIPGLGYTLAFDTNQLNFAQRFENVQIPILLTTNFVQLPNPLVLASNIELALETGTNTNVFLSLTVGTDCLVDSMAGIIYFVSTFGVELTQGSTGTASGTTFTDPSANFTGLGVQAGDYLLVLMDTKGVANGVYTITAVPSGTHLTLDVAVPAGSGTLSYQILRGKEIMADRFFETILLVDPTTSVERLTALGDIQNATTLVPTASATFPDLNTLQDNSTDFVAAGVQPGDTITLTPESGTTASFTAVASPNVTVHGLTGMQSSFVGQNITFSGAANSHNNGTFQIVTFISSTQIQIHNPTGVAPDPNNGSIHWTLEQNKGTFLVLQVAQHTLTPTTSFVTVDPSSYTVTRRLQVPLSFIGTLRFRFGSPTGTNAGTFSTTVQIVPQDSDFSTPSSMPQGKVQISQATGNLNFSSIDVLAGGTVFMSRRLALGTDYQVQPQLGLIQLATRLLTNEEVLLTYTQAPPNTSPPTPPGPPFQNERGTFLVRKELTQPHPTPTSTLFFNTTNKSVASNPPARVFRGGRPQVTNTQVIINPGPPSSMTFLPDNILTNALPHGAIVSPNENVYIDYYVYQAMGGEQTLTVLNPPLLVASVTITSGTNEFFIAGDQTGNFPAGFIMTLGGENGLQVYQIGTSTYDGTNKQTTVTLAGPQTFQTDEINPPLQVASGPTPLTSSPNVPAYFTMELAPYYTIARGQNSFYVPGDKRGIYQTNVVLYVTNNGNTFQDFYLVTGAKYDGGTGLTQVTLTTPALRQYTFGQQTIFWSVRPIFAQAPTVAHTNRTPVTVPQPEPVVVIRRIAGQVGQILKQPTGYSFDASGAVTYATPLQPDEEFSIFYTGLRNVLGGPGPVPVNGPRLNANYTATIVPDLTTNGLLGQVLNANYTIFSPDNFFYRVETMTNFKGQVAQEIQAAAQSQSSPIGSGPMTSNTSTPALYNQGIPSVWFPPGDYANHDLIAIASLLYFNNAINYLEDALHAMDGRIVGDADGRFMFDGVIGRFNYYTYDPTVLFAPTYPSPGNIYNQIDDNIQFMPGPLPDYPDSLAFFQQSYVIGPSSRFFKTVRNVRTQAPLVVSATPNAGDVTGTFNFSQLTSLPSVAFRRGPRAQIVYDTSYGSNTFFVDNVVGDGTLRPPWTPNPPAPVTIAPGMLVVVEDPQGNFYIDENDNCIVTAVTPAIGGNPGQIQVSGIPHDPVGSTGSPPSNTDGTTAGIIGFDSNGDPIVAGIAGMGPRQIGLQLTLSGAASGPNNGSFKIKAILSPTSCAIHNPSAVVPDANNGAITWAVQTVGLVPAGSTIYLSPIDVCVAQQQADGVDSGGAGTYGMSYGIGKDVNIDLTTGNVLYQNAYWPFDGNSFFKLPEIFIPQSSYIIPVLNGDILEADGMGVAVTYTAPFKFPALLGQRLNDDGDQSIPLVGPSYDGEITQNAAVVGGNLAFEAAIEVAGSAFRTTTTTPPYTTYGGSIKGSLDVTKTVITLTAGPFPTPIPKHYDLVRIVSGSNGQTAWRRIVSVSNIPPASVTVDVADAFAHQDSGFDFAIAVSAAAPIGLTQATLTTSAGKPVLQDAGKPFTGGTVTMLGIIYGVVTVTANSYNTSVLDTITVVPPSGAGANYGSVTTNSPYTIGDIVTGPGIATTATIIQIGPGNSIRLSVATTGGSQTGATFLIQLTQPPPTGSPLTLTGDVSMTGALSGSAASITAFTTPLVTATGLTGVTTSDTALIGQSITFSGTGSGNDGSFTIAAILSNGSIQYINPGATAPDTNNGSISWSIPASPSIKNVVTTNNMAGLQIGAQITSDTHGWVTGSKVTIIGGGSPPYNQITLDTTPSGSGHDPSIVFTTAQPDKPWSTTVNTLGPNSPLGIPIPPTQNDTSGFGNYPADSVPVSGNGIPFTPPSTYTHIHAVVSATELTLDKPVTASTYTGSPLPTPDPTTESKITIFAPLNVTPGWTVVITSGPNIGLRRQIVSIKDTQTVILDAPFPTQSGGPYNYRIDNPLNTYDGQVFDQLNTAMNVEQDAIVNRTAPASPPYVPNEDSEQGALLKFFTQVFSTQLGPSSNGAVSGTILHDSTHNFIGPDPANPNVTTSYLVYVHVGNSGVQKQDQGIYAVSTVVDDHHLMVTPAFPAAGTVTYEIVSVFGIGTKTLQNIFSIFAANAAFVDSTQTFQALLASPSLPPYNGTGNVNVLISGSVDNNVYANGLNDAQDDLGNRYIAVGPVSPGRIGYLQDQSMGPIAFIENALNSGDNLNAKRYSWINGRINLQSGYLILKNTSQAQVAVNQANIFNQLIQLLTIQSS